MLGTDDDPEIAIAQLGIDPDEITNPYRGLSSIGGVARCHDCGWWRKRGGRCTCLVHAEK